MPSHTWSYLYRGRCLSYLGRHEEAAAAFRSAIRVNPRQAEAYIFLADLLAEDGKASDAMEVLKQARTVLPESLAIRKVLDRLEKGEKPSLPAEPALPGVDR
jgi:tetratricopeptide (TPR) repeat protein